jgi:hypothetical protein
MNGTVDMAFGSEIDDGTRFVHGEQVIDQIAITDVAVNENMAIVAVQSFQRLQIAGIGQLVEVDHCFIEMIQPIENEIPPDEAGAPRNQYRHFAFILT